MHGDYRRIPAAVRLRGALRVPFLIGEIPGYPLQREMEKKTGLQPPCAQPRAELFQPLADRSLAPVFQNDKC